MALDIRHIFNAPNVEEAHRLLQSTIGKSPKLSEWLEVQMPKHHQLEIRTTNLAECVNREIKRRTHERLITAILVEMAEEWLDTDRVYLKMNE